MVQYEGAEPFFFSKIQQNWWKNIGAHVKINRKIKSIGGMRYEKAVH